MQPTARQELDHIKASTDWTALIEMALAAPPKPAELCWKYSMWAQTFQVVHGRCPAPIEHSQEMDEFFKTLAFADIPQEVKDWVSNFEASEGRKPRLAELPKNLQAMIPKSKRGRPRCDTQRLRNAARAWEAQVFRESYELRREAIAVFGKSGAVETCFGFDRASMKQDRPSVLAYEKLSEETGKSVDYLKDLIHPRRK